jgi:hypothetical protein
MRQYKTHCFCTADEPIQPDADNNEKKKAKRELNYYSKTLL